MSIHENRPSVAAGETEPGAEGPGTEARFRDKHGHIWTESDLDGRRDLVEAFRGPLVELSSDQESEESP